MPTMRAGSRYPITPCCGARTRTGGLSFAGHRMDLFTASYRHLAHEAARTANATPRSKPSRRGVSIFPKLYRRQTNWVARDKAGVSSATLQQFLDAQKKDQCYLTDDPRERRTRGTEISVCDVGQGGQDHFV